MTVNEHKHLLCYNHHNGNSRFDNVRTEATHISGPSGKHYFNIMFSVMFRNVCLIRKHYYKTKSFYELRTLYKARSCHVFKTIKKSSLINVRHIAI